MKRKSQNSTFLKGNKDLQLNWTISLWIVGSRTLFYIEDAQSVFEAYF